MGGNVFFMIHIIAPSRYRISKRQTQKDVAQIMQRLRIPSDLSLNIIFVGRRKMREIANAYKHEDVALPVLAFPYKDVPEETENFWAKSSSATLR